MLRETQKITLLIAILLFGMAMTFLAAVQGPGSLSADGAPAPMLPVPGPFHQPGLSVYFTDPARDSFRGGPETGLLAAIDHSRVEVDVAAYEIDLWGFRDALIAAARRGVSVRVVLEQDQADNPEVEALRDVGIPIVTDGAAGLMHDKFVLIDRRQVWTGSMNFTLNGAYRNDNNLVALNSPEAAAVFRAEFEEMFLDGLFGALSPPGIRETVQLEGSGGQPVRVDILFSPDDHPVDAIVDLLEKAERQIQFMAFSFTADEIGAAMIDAADRGVQVRGVFDESQLRSNRGSEFDLLRFAGLDVRIDGSRDKMHHKVIVIDGEIVVTGSYNFSASAETRNDENLLIIYDREAADVFLEEWMRIFEAGE